MFLLPASFLFASPPQNFFPPESLFLDWKIVAKDRSGVVLLATIKSMVGTNSDLKISFESTKDLAVQPASAQVPSLAEGSQKQFEIKVAKTGAPLNKRTGSWVHLRVEYFPDYAALQKRVITNHLIPAGLRQKLLQEYETNQKKRKKTVAHEKFLFIYPDMTIPDGWKKYKKDDWP
jgi:hypothetical protein